MDSQNAHSEISSRSPDHTPIDRSTIAPFACSIEDAPGLVGVSRTRIFDAIRSNHLTVRKAGKSTLVEISELRRWFYSLPVKGKQQLIDTAA